MSGKLTVLNPEGYPPKVTASGMAPGLDSLEGKTLFLVDVGFENSDNFIRQLHGWLADHEPVARMTLRASRSPSVVATRQSSPCGSSATSSAIENSAPAASACSWVSGQSS